MDELFFNSYGEKEAIKCVWIMCLGERVWGGRHLAIYRLSDLCRPAISGGKCRQNYLRAHMNVPSCREQASIGVHIHGLSTEISILNQSRSNNTTDKHRLPTPNQFPRTSMCMNPLETQSTWMPTKHHSISNIALGVSQWMYFWNLPPLSVKLLRSQCIICTLNGFWPQLHTCINIDSLFLLHVALSMDTGYWVKPPCGVKCKGATSMLQWRLGF
jgi:hypothetical protein